MVIDYLSKDEMKKILKQYPKCAFCDAEAQWMLGRIREEQGAEGYGVAAKFCNKHLIEKVKALERVILKAQKS